MPKCPKCGNDIDFLKNYVSGITEDFNFTVDAKGYPEYEHVDSYLDDEAKNEFCCPECGATLFVDEKDAINFLLGKTTQVSVSTC
jgi:transcription initiation factor IIE alpha subunit